MFKSKLILLVLLGLSLGLKAQQATRSQITERILCLASPYVISSMPISEQAKATVNPEYGYALASQFLINHPTFTITLTNFEKKPTPNSCSILFDNIAKATGYEPKTLSLWNRIVAFFTSNKLEKEREIEAICQNILNPNIEFEEITNNFQNLMKKWYIKTPDTNLKSLNIAPNPIIMNTLTTDKISQITRKNPDLGTNLSKKIKDALSPSDKSDLEKADKLLRAAARKAARWFTILKCSIR